MASCDEALFWKVVGGADKGGILVREGKELASKATASRLATGAIIKKLALIGDRLQFQKVHGEGPETGWVSRRLTDKELVIPTEAPEGTAAAESPAKGGSPVPRPPPVLAARKLRVLCLHGTAASPTVFKSQLRPLIAQAQEDIEFIFHAGHLVCDESDPIVGPQVKLMTKFFPPPFTQYAIPTGGGGPEAIDGREDPSTWRTYEGLEECLARVQEALRKEAPIDAVLGFSQGSNIANLVAAQATLGLGANLNCVVNLCTSKPGWMQQLPHLFEQPLAIPALVVYAEKDKVATGYAQVAEVYAEEMVQVTKHSDDHRPFPKGTDEASALAKQTLDFLLQHCKA